MATCHKDLRLIAETHLHGSDQDFAFVEGTRSLARQQKVFNEGKSKVDGFIIRGKHNYLPSLAFDIVPVVRGKWLWEEGSQAYLAGGIMRVAFDLLADGKISHELRWGGNWNRDGEVIKGQNFIDLPHFELIMIDGETYHPVKE